MKKLNLKVLIGVITFVIGVFAVGLFAYRFLISENINYEVTKTVEVKQSEISEEEKVYLEILNELFIKNGDKSLAISDKTNFYSNLEYLEKTTSDERI